MFTFKRPDDGSFGKKDGMMRRHPIITNIVIIAIVAVLGMIIAYLSLTLFTKHGQKGQVPDVVGIGYTQAIEKLHDSGFKIEIRDSLYLDNVKPGYVVEQYPNAMSMVKPGRKVFLYINAVNPKQVMVASSGREGSVALDGISKRQALAILEECGFRNVKVKYLRGDYADRVVRVVANGRTVRVREKVPVNASIVLEVYDGSRREATESMQADALWKDAQERREEEELLNPETPEEPTEDPVAVAVEEEPATEPEYIEY